MDDNILHALDELTKHLEAIGDFAANPPPDQWYNTRDNFRICALDAMLHAILMADTVSDIRGKLTWLGTELHRLVPELPESLKGKARTDPSYWLSYLDTCYKQYGNTTDTRIYAGDGGSFDLDKQIKALNEAFKKHDELLNEKEIQQCSNANLNKGICPAARDTFYRLLAEHEANYFNIPEEKRETFIKDYMSGKTRNEKQN